MKWNFLYKITAAPGTPDWEATAPQIPVLSVLCPQLNLLNPPPRKKIPGYATGSISYVVIRNVERQQWDYWNATSQQVAETSVQENQT